MEAADGIAAVVGQISGLTSARYGYVNLMGGVRRARWLKASSLGKAHGRVAGADGGQLELLIQAPSHRHGHLFSRMQNLFNHDDLGVKGFHYPLIARRSETVEMDGMNLSRLQRDCLHSLIPPNIT